MTPTSKSPLLAADERRAACEGMWALFDSTYPEDHAAAKAICATCPIALTCDDRLREELAIGRTMRMAGGGPRGTWAGRLIGKAPKDLFTAKCGTDSGYHRHRRQDEPICAECRRAHSLAERERRSRGAA